MPLRAIRSREAFKLASHLVFCGLRGELYGTLWHAAGGTLNPNSGLRATPRLAGRCTRAIPNGY